MTTRRRLAVLTVAVLAAVGLTPAASSSASVVDSWTWPASGTLTVYGHGYGHGHGLSQWGAYGAATKGLTYAQIVAFYYKGTTLGTVTDPALRVLVTSDTDNATQVAPAAGLTAHTVDGTVVLPPTAGAGTVTSWRAVRNTSGLVVQYLVGSTWSAFAIGGTATHTGEVSFTATGNVVRLVLGSTRRAYRGTVAAVPTGTSPTVRTVVSTSMSDYLKSVVPSEMPSSWSAAALQAQAVAARTYASYDRAHKPSGRYYDTCDSTSCQVFKGAADYSSTGTLLTNHEATSSTTAVTSTANRVVLYQGALAFTQFSSSNGGWAAAGSQPYLAAFADPYDGVHPSSANTWTTTLTASALQSAYPSMGTLRSVTTTRDGNGEWGGRVTGITLHGTTADVTLTGDQLRTATGMKSTWWAPASTGWKRYDKLVGPGDWDSDGRVDVIARTTDGKLWLATGLSAGTAPARQIGAGWQGFASILGPGDWTGDGKPDVITRGTDGLLKVYAGAGTGGFRSVSTIGAGWNQFTALIAPGDLSGDGKPDLLARTSTGHLRLYRGNGAGGFGAVTEFGAGWQIFTALAGPGDLTGDGRPDVLARLSDGTLRIYPGTGTGGLGAPLTVGTGWNGFNAIERVGDWDQDGHADVLARTAGGSLYVYLGNGAGGFRTRLLVGAA